MGYAVIGRLEAIVLRQALYKRGVCIRRVEQVRIRGVLHHYHENVVQMGERGRLRPALTELRDALCLVRDRASGAGRHAETDAGTNKSRRASEK